MAPVEYCNSLACLRDGSSPDFDTFERGTPSVGNRTPFPPPVSRVLPFDSIPTFDMHIIDINGPRQPKAQYGAIGSERKNLGSPSHAKIESKPLILEKDFADNEDTTSSKLELARLATRKVSKFAKLFGLSEPHGETSNVNPVHESNHIVTTMVTDTTSTNKIRSERGFTCPKMEHYGDMSNLRPDDQGMDTATCVEFYRQSMIEHHKLVIAANPINREAFAALQELEQLTAIDSDDKGASTSKKVTFNLGAQFATPSSPENRADTRARSRELANQEAATLKKSKQRDERALPLFDPPLKNRFYPEG